METIRHYIEKSSDYLQKKKIDNYRFHAEQLLAECLKIDRLQLYLRLDFPINDEEIAAYRRKLQVFNSTQSQADHSLKAIYQALLKSFEKNNIPEPDISAKYIIAHALQIKPIEIPLSYSNLVSLEQRQQIKSMVRRRLQQEPIAYILGYTEFYGYSISVTKATLIPRPETELLVEYMLQKLTSEQPLSGLDIGTGSACISVALLKERHSLSLTATDISEAALHIARKNAHQNGVEIDLIHHNILDRLTWADFAEFDFIVSNPPYIPENEYVELEINVKDYEPKIALTDQSDGFEFYRTIIDFAKEKLKPSGWLFFEVGYNQAKKIAELISAAGCFADTDCQNDLNGHNRIVAAKKVQS